MTSIYVCLSVGSLAYLANRTAELYRIFLHVAHDHGLVLLWRRCDTLCISGFVDDVMFLVHGHTTTANTAHHNSVARIKVIRR